MRTKAPQMKHEYGFGSMSITFHIAQAAGFSFFCVNSGPLRIKKEKDAPLTSTKDSQQDFSAQLLLRRPRLFFGCISVLMQFSVLVFSP
uniref:Putative ovule protein n=1 Tax=Solanum chacoense TaxID=4108 RepID=A0A0V0GMQ2_SOLCH